MENQKPNSVIYGAANAGSIISAQKQANDLRLTLSIFYLTVDCIDGIDMDEENDILVQATDALKKIDGKLQKLLDERIVRSTAHQPEEVSAAAAI